jgi:hypothetical protein
MVGGFAVTMTTIMAAVNVEYTFSTMARGLRLYQGSFDE